jgi:hypothetical protein
MDKQERIKLMEELNNFFETRDKQILTASEYVYILRTIDNKPHLNYTQIKYYLIHEITEKRKQPTTS